jgi:enoyl-CoA hydratase/carnithine racemase
MRFTIKVIPSLSGRVGKIQLNNPSALHALDLDMIRAMKDILSSYSNVKATILTSNNDPEEEKNDSKKKKRNIFCAGGDVKSVYMAGMGLNQRQEDINAKNQSQHGYGCTGLYTCDFFREENQLNYKIATQPPHSPQISIWDGVVMGGGVGISVHGKYRIATENSLFAMPETNIGLIPDVGGTYFLPRLEGGIGTYLGLTGARLKPNDLIYGGLATHYIKSEYIPEVISHIEKKSVEEYDKIGDCVSSILMSYHEDPGQFDSFLAQNRDYIDEAFQNKESIEDIIVALESLGPDSKFGTMTLGTLKKMSPTALKVTLEGMKRGKKLSNIGESLQMEFRMTQSLMKEDSDFYEGIRALLVDKDNTPKWNPPRLEDVTDEMVQSYFSHLGDDELVLVDDNVSESKL